MTNVTKLASVALAALVLSTALVQAGPRIFIGGIGDAVQGGVKGGESTSPGTPFGGIEGPGTPFDDLADNDDGPVIIDLNGKPHINYDGTIMVKPQIEIHPEWLNAGGGKPGGKPSGNTAGKPVLVLDVAIACQVAGTPVEFPDDLLLINHGAALSAGTTIKWKVKAAGQGFVQLPKDLPTGGSIKAPGVLGAGVEAGKPCTAKIV
jgi:hypothetical protein